MIKKLRAIETAASIGLPAYYVISLSKHLITGLKISEVAISAIAIAIAVLAGIWSVYIARATKTLPGTPRIFISYSFEEQEKARKLRDVLEEKGAKVWLDENALQPGVNLRSAIGAAIESSNTVVAMLSDRTGPHLRAELRAAFARRVPVIAVLSSAADAPAFLLEHSNVRVLDAGTDLATVAAAALTTR